MREKDHPQYAEDARLNRILKQIVGDFTQYADFQHYHLSRYAEIGMSMSGENDTGKLLELIVFEAREITGADAGTLYMMDHERTCLRFVILQNDTMNTRMGGTSGQAITLPPVPLFLAEGENHSNVSSHVALTGELVNIPDVYQNKEFDFTGPRKYDEATGYRSRSMLVIPLRNHENDIIGVLQLLNALDPDTQENVKFSDDSVGLVTALASQAAVAITKTELIQDLKKLLDSFIKAIAAAIDEKSPYTGGHISRVASLTMMIAERINQSCEGPFKDTRLTPEQMEELRVAAWLHDIGKITTPESVVDKRTKLETIFDREQLVALRFDFLAKAMEAECLRDRIACLEQGDQLKAATLETRLSESLRVLGEEREFVLACNSPDEFMDDDKITRLRKVAEKSYTVKGTRYPYLTENEVENLCIRKGSLSGEERKVIENHASMTYKMLKELPFPKKMTMVPEIAGGHHEKLDGTGYPFGLSEKDIPLQARIVAVADVFEALTAGDRPYKQAMPLSKALQILGFMKKDRHIDPDVHDLFIQSGIVESYALSNLRASQIDVELKPLAPVTPEPGDKGKDSMAEMAPGPRPAPCDNTRRILVVDDSANTRMLLQFFLKHGGFAVDTAENGCLGLAKFSTIPFDIVLMDMELPDMDGFTATKAIRQWEEQNNEPPTPVVALTTHGYSEETDHPEKSLFARHLSKPTKKAELLSVVETLLQEQGAGKKP